MRWRSGYPTKVDALMHWLRRAGVPTVVERVKLLRPRRRVAEREKDPIFLGRTSNTSRRDQQTRRSLGDAGRVRDLRALIDGPWKTREPVATGGARVTKSFVTLCKGINES
jgi:hypothetical protein